METVTKDLLAGLTAQFDLAGMLRLVLIIAVGSLLLGLVGRLVFGKRSGLNHSVSSAIGILFVYAVTIVIYTFDPANLSRFLSPLPFVSFHGEYLLIFSFTGSEFPAICAEILNMVILAFLVNLLDTVIPKGRNVLTWYLLRFVTVVLAMAAQLVVTGLLTAYLPGVLVTYAPIILVGILLVMVLLGVLKALLGLVLTITNPILGAIYAFFFSSKIGKMLGKAVTTTLLLSALVYLLGYLGFGVVSITAAALTGYIPLVIVLLIMWYLLGHVL
ncbi:MAG: hypothetical protein IJ375_04760 [Oscillospiraceae bacterium]|nr:hypothetical protein [Oscillospiraceae bacterium]